MVAATAADAASRSPLAVLEKLLTHSIRLRDLYKNARWRFPSGQFGGLRRIFHYKEQVSLIDAIVDRIPVLGGTVGVFASEFLQSAPSCRLLRGPRALDQLLHEFFDAHESVLSVARPRDANDDQPWVRDFAVGQVALTNEQQRESINEVLLKNEPPLRFRQADF